MTRRLLQPRPLPMESYLQTEAPFIFLAFIKTILKTVARICSEIMKYCCLSSVIMWKRDSVGELYRAIHKSLRNFRPLRYSSPDGHAEGERVNRGRDTPSFCPTLQVLVMSTLGDAADVNSVIKFLPHTLHVCGMSSTCKVGQKLGVSLPLLTCSPSAWPSRLLYGRGRKSRRELRIILYISHVKGRDQQISANWYKTQ
jgi:hypothetical protein